MIHFAALKAVGESCEKPFAYFQNNIGGLTTLLALMQKHWIKNILFSSSATVYDTQATDSPYDETAPRKTINPYGKTKWVAELLLEDAAQFANMQVVALRYFNPIGAHTSGLIGENPAWIPNNLLPFVYRVATGEYPVLNIFGDDYPTEDGTCLRDYIHVMDLASAHVAAYKHLAELQDQNWYFKAINIGTGKPTSVLESVLEIVSAVEKVVWKEIPYTIAPRRQWDASSVYSNPALAKELLWREAQYSVEEAIKDWWNFIQKKSGE